MSLRGELKKHVAYCCYFTFVANKPFVDFIIAGHTPRLEQIREDRFLEMEKQMLG